MLDAPPKVEITSQPFNALNGEELRHALLKELDLKLSNYDEFRAHLAYSKYMYLVEVKIAIDAYPKSETQTSTVTVANKSPNYTQEKDHPPKRFNLKWGSTEPVTRPDKVRREAGLPVPEAQATSDGQIVDMPTEPK